MLTKKQKVNESEVLKFGFLGGIGMAVYCFLAASLIMTLNVVMPKPANNLAGPLLVLLFFVFSVAISGVLVFGYPAYLGFQKRYLEALMTLATTLVTIAIIGILVFMLISLI